MYSTKGSSTYVNDSSEMTLLSDQLRYSNWPEIRDIRPFNYHSLDRSTMDKRESPVQSSYSNENEGSEIPSGIVQERRALFSRGSTRRTLRGYSTMPSSWKEKKGGEGRRNRYGVTLGESIDSRTIYSPPMDPLVTARSHRIDVMGIGITATPSTILRGGPFDPETRFQRTSDCCVIRAGSGRRGTVWTFPQAGSDSSTRTYDLPVKSETLPRRVPVREVTIRTIPQKREAASEWKGEGPLRVMKDQSEYGPPPAYGARPTNHPPPLPSTVNNNNREDKLDPQEIRKTCEVIRESLLEEPPKNMSLQSRLHTMEIEMAELSRALNSSQTLIDQLHNVAASGSSNYSSISGEDDDSLSETNSQIISLRNQIAIHSQSLSNKDVLVKRLEKELNDAQQCNHALNSQLGLLASSPGANLKRDLNEIKKELKKKNSDYDELKKINMRLENEREQQRRLLDSRVPPDVQTLMAQKRELTHQLDREQNEKHELFMQINSLIAQVAGASDGKKEKDEIERLAKEIKSLESLLETERDSVRRKKEELELSAAKNEIEKKKLANEVESLKNKLSSEVETMEKELNMKSAALQSMMLAKQEPKDDGAKKELERLNEEIEEERRNAEILKRNHDSLVASSSKISRDYEEKVQILEEEMRELERKLDNSLKETAETREKVNSSDGSRRDLEDRLRRAEEESEIMKGRLDIEKERGDSLERRLESTSGEKGEEVRLLESQLSDAREKERNLLEKMKEVEEKSRRLSEGSAVELALLKKSLEEEKEKGRLVAALEAKLVIAHKERDEIERRSKDLEKQHEDTQSEMKRAQSARGNVHDELMTLVKSLQESRQHNEELSNENAQLMKELNESREENEQMHEEMRVREDEIGEWKERSHRAETSTSTLSSSLEEEKIQMKNENERLKKKYEELLNEAEISQKVIEELEDEKQSLLDSSRDKEERMEGEIERAIADTTSARAEMTKMGLRLKDLESESRKHEGRAEELQRRIESIMDDSEKTAGVQALEAAEKATKMKEAEEFSRKIKKQLEELEKENSERLAEKEEIHRGNVQKLSEQVTDLQSKLATSSSLLIESELNIKRMHTELEELRRKDVERTKNEMQTSSHASESDRLREKAEKEKGDLERRIELFAVEKVGHERELIEMKMEMEKLKSELEVEKNRPNYEPALHRLKDVLILETAAKERIEREKENVKKELDEERRRPNQEAETLRLKEALIAEGAAKERLEKETRELKMELEDERRKPNHEPELHRLKESLILERAAKERIEKESSELRSELEEERRKPNHEPELHRLKELLVVETVAKERIEREAKEVKKELEEERRKPNLQPELNRLQDLLKAESTVRERLEVEKREIEEEMKKNVVHSNHVENGHSSPVAPPRKGKDSHSSSVSSTISENIDPSSQTPADRVKHLENQVAKKDRIIGVLRRKIHQQQLALL